MSLFSSLTGTTNPEKQIVWRKGHIIPGSDPSIFRRDDFGYTIRFDDYGDRKSEYGWEIDHIVATIVGGSDSFQNLRPLHWRKNARLGGLLGGLIGR